MAICFAHVSAPTELPLDIAAKRAPQAQGESELRGEKQGGDEYLSEVGEERRSVAFEPMTQELQRPAEHERRSGDGQGRGGAQAAGRLGGRGEQRERQGQCQPESEIE